jgi:hypothetical protein
MSKKYPKIKDGELIQPVMKGYRMACCDCGLVHKIDFKIVGKKIQFRAYRDNRATGQFRRHNK